MVSRVSSHYTISWNELQQQGLPSNCKAVINCAGQNILDFKKKWTEEFKQEVFASRVNTTGILARLIDEASEKPDSFITMSGVGKV